MALASAALATTLHQVWWNKDTGASGLNIGLQWDFNARLMKKITSPESSFKYHL